MSKRLLYLWGVLVVCGLVACQAAATPTLAPSPTPVPTSTRVLAMPTATPVGEATKEVKPEPTATTESATDAETEASWQIPQVGDGEWTKGTAGAGLVVVEYSDFQ